MRHCTWIATVALAIFLSPGSASRAVDLPLFFEDFEQGHLGHWTEDVGNACPKIPEIPDVQTFYISKYVLGEAPDRIVVYERFSELVDTAHGRHLSVELYEALAAPMGPATIDLGAGIQKNYQTCATCVVFYLDYETADGSFTKAFFQKSGILEIDTLDPADPETFDGTLSALLEEVTIEPGTYRTTPVPDGCIVPLLGFPLTPPGA